MRKDKLKPTESELEILNVIWQKGASTVRDVHTELEKRKESKYTTTLKLMQIMHEKGLLIRDASARTHIFSAAIPKEETQGELLKTIIENVYNGSASQLVMQALGNHKSSAEELEKIKQYLETIENKDK
ncbi:MAG: BlaI/MecI/CopY family transcriptional regulator [Flavipsychrobacter sp.]